MTLPKICPCAFCIRGNQTIENAVAAWLLVDWKSVGEKENDRHAAWLEPPRGTPRGRFNVLSGVRVELCLPAKEFGHFAEKRGIDPTHIRELFGSRPVRLAPDTEPRRCTIIPRNN